MGVDPWVPGSFPRSRSLTWRNQPISMRYPLVGRWGNNKGGSHVSKKHNVENLSGEKHGGTSWIWIDDLINVKPTQKLIHALGIQPHSQLAEYFS